MDSTRVLSRKPLIIKSMFQVLCCSVETCSSVGPTPTTFQQHPHSAAQDNLFVWARSITQLDRTCFLLPTQIDCGRLQWRHLAPSVIQCLLRPERRVFPIFS